MLSGSVVTLHPITNVHVTIYTQTIYEKILAGNSINDPNLSEKYSLSTVGYFVIFGSVSDRVEILTTISFAPFF